MYSAVLGLWEDESFISKKNTVVRSQSVNVKKEISGTLLYRNNNDSHLFKSIREVMKLGIQMMESTKDSSTSRLKSSVMELPIT